LALGAPSSVADPPGQVPTGDSASGAGSGCPPSPGIPRGCLFDLIFGAEVDPAGGALRGSFHALVNFGGPTQEIGGTATCLAVTGNSAVIGFGAPGGPSTFYVAVVDGGPDPLDTFRIFLAETQGCANQPMGGGGPLTSGGIEVRDVPLLTSRDQCAQGGYTQWAFNNQGQCVALVERGPKP
jgi:hypothetical protein